MLSLLLLACEPVTVRFEPVAADPFLPPPADPERVPATVEEEAPVSCAAPEERRSLGPFAASVDDGPRASVASLWSGGILGGDLDGDGAPELVAPYEQFARLVHGGPDGLVREDELLGGLDLTWGSGGSLADVDGDGDLDLLVLRYGEQARLVANVDRGFTRFEDHTVLSGLDIVGPTTSSAWGDVDGDGDLDLFVGAWGDPEQGTPGGAWLYESRGDGTFLDRTEALPEQVRRGYTRVAGFHDLDGDALPELYVVNDIGSVQPNVLLRNVGGRFVPDAGRSGLDLAMSGGGLGVGDVNGDGVPDLLVPQWDDLSLMLSSDDGRFVDHAQALGLVPDPARGQAVGWGAELADLDNDGDLDGVVAYGRLEVDLPGWENPEVQHDALFLQGEDGTFEDVAPAWGVDDAGTGRGFLVADLDGNGWLDLVKRELEGPTRVYLARCGEGHWATVRLRDPGVANRFAVGAQVTLVTSDGERLSRTVTAGGTGFGSGGSPDLHFGLGEADGLAWVEVTWPDGRSSVVGYGAGVDRVVTIVRTP